MTVLTSMDDAALQEIGRAGDGAGSGAGARPRGGGGGGDGPGVQRAGSGRGAGAGGRRRVVLCTPGIRPAGVAANDQARTETPGSAIQAGSDLLVIGRPITAASDMTEAARAIEAEVDAFC